MSAPEKDAVEPEPLAPEVYALALNALAARAKKELDPTKALFSDDYRNGAKETFRSPLDDAKLGHVYRQDPDPFWKVTDDAALRTHLAGLGAEDTWHEVSGPEHEVVAVLLEHAPHLVATRTAVPDETVAAVLAATQAAGKPVDPDGHPVPGVERIRPVGNLVVSPDKNAGTAINALIRAGRLDLTVPAQLPPSR